MSMSFALDSFPIILSTDADYDIESFEATRVVVVELSTLASAVDRETV